MIRYAIIGTGWITETFIRGAYSHSDLTLCAVYSRTAEKGRAFAEKMQEAGRGEPIRVYTSLPDMAADSTIQAVYIASPNREHVPQAEAMLRAGKHVISEKPIAVDSKDLIRLMAIAKEQGVVYIEAIMMLHQPQLQVLQQAMARIGRIRSGHIDFSQYSSKYAGYLKYLEDPKTNPLPNIFNPAMQTGALEDLGIYCLYLVTELFGMPEKPEESLITTAYFMESGADAGGEVIFRYPNSHITVTYSKVGQGYTGSQIIGDQGTITIDSISQLTGMRLRLHGQEPELLWGEEEKDDLMGREAADFTAMIRGELAQEYYQQRALEVCELMQLIRDRSGIRFTEG